MWLICNLEIRITKTYISYEKNLYITLCKIKDEITNTQY